MRIVVLVKHVPDASADRGFDPADHTTDRAGVDGLLSELDEYAVETALMLIETVLAETPGPAADSEVVALTMGPAAAADALRRALQMGATSGVHVQDDALHGSDAPATSLVLAAAVRRLGDIDLVLTGMASTDGGMSVVPAMLAERLGLPHVGFAGHLEIEGATVVARRDGDAATEVVEADLPAIVSVTDQVGEPRYPSFKGIMAAKKKPVQTWSLADLDVAAADVGLDAAWTSVRSLERVPGRSQGEVIVDEGDAGARLVAFLAERRLV